MNGNPCIYNWKRLDLFLSSFEYLKRSDPQWIKKLVHFSIIEAKLCLSTKSSYASGICQLSLCLECRELELEWAHIEARFSFVTLGFTGKKPRANINHSYWTGDSEYMFIYDMHICLYMIQYVMWIYFYIWYAYRFIYDTIYDMHIWYNIWYTYMFIYDTIYDTNLY